MAWGPRPRRHTPRPPPPLLASRPERNIAPAGHSTAWLTSSVKEISPLLAQNGQNTALFAVPGRRIFHGTPQHLTRGRFFFHPSPIPTPRRDKTHPARPHQRPSGKKFSQHAQNTPKSALFRLQGEFFLGLTQNPDLLGEFSLAHKHPRFYPRRTLRPQPKPRVVCTKTATSGTLAA